MGSVRGGVDRVCRRGPAVGALLSLLLSPVVLTAAVALLGCRSTSPVSVITGPPLIAAGPPPVAAPRSARSPQECQLCRGIWGPQGLSGALGCNCRTRDAGKHCRDRADCEGQCVLGDVPERSPEPTSERGYFVGRCSELVTVFGCARFLPRGAARSGPVSLSEPPPIICVD